LVVIKVNVLECEIQGSHSCDSKDTVFLDRALCSTGKALLTIRTVVSFDVSVPDPPSLHQDHLFSTLSLLFYPEDAECAFLINICNDLHGSTSKKTVIFSVFKVIT
jgi:hypothetical protein